MFDYDALNILAEVVKNKGFNKAATKLRLTQPAVTKRVRTLEDQIGKPLLYRTNPPSLTDYGKRLVQHLDRVKFNERELSEDLIGANEKVNLKIGVNADTVATWFFRVVKSVVKDMSCVLELIVENETLTHELLRKGEVAGCVTTQSKPLPGCESEYIASIPYPCVASREFVKEYFKDGFNIEGFKIAPTVFFDYKDTLPFDFLKTLFGKKAPPFPFFSVPSSEGCFKIVEQGLAYGLVPIFQAKEGLKNGALIELFPHKRLQIRLFWQYPLRRSVFMKNFSDKFIISARKDFNRSN